MGLFKPAWMSKDRKKAIASVQKEVDQLKLVQIALNATLTVVQKEAVKRISSQEMLFRVAVEGIFSIAMEAVQSIDDEKLLLGIMNNAVDGFARNKAADKLAEKGMRIPVKYCSSHKWQCLNSKEAKCEKCGTVSMRFESLKYGVKEVIEAEHDWEVQKKFGKCAWICTRCGDTVAYNLQGIRVTYSDGNRDKKLELRNTDLHKWKELSGCRKKCLACGVMVYDHTYEKIGSFYYDGDDLGVYKCKKCGHGGDFTIERQLGEVK